MAKKNRINSKVRQSESQKRKEHFRKISLEQEEKEQQLRRENEEKQEIQEIQETLAKAENLSIEAPHKKSAAKATGLKSAILLEQGKILVTSFGKGNTAIPQVEVTFHQDGEKVSHEIKPVCGEKSLALRITPQEKQLKVEGRANISAAADNPIYRCNGAKYQNMLQMPDVAGSAQPSGDLIGAKAALERRYFDTTDEFADNLHIQIIHAIQDIEKIVAVYATEIVCTLNNILGKKEDGQPVDLVGMMSLDKTYQNFMRSNPNNNFKHFEELLKKKQLMYFGDIIPQATRDKKGERIELTDEKKEEAYLVLATLGTIRQATTHGDGRNKGALFSMESEGKRCQKEAITLLKKQYSNRVEQLNRSFAEYAYKDVSIICKVLKTTSDEEKEIIICDYYNYIIRKTYKTLGFSVKALREVMSVMDEFQWMNLETYNPVRHKLNHIVDFFIVRYFGEHEDEADRFVERLRSCGADRGKRALLISDDKNYEKRSLYVMQVCQMKAVLKQWLGKTLQENIIGSEIAKAKGYDPSLPENKVWEKALAKNQLGTTARTFSTMMYLMTRFLDGKEINELLTKTANRFDNIASFIDIASKFKVNLSFRNNYEMFADSKEIAEEIRVINSFARMSEEMGNVPEALMKDAAILLGLSQKDDIDTYVHQIMTGELTLGSDQNHEFRNFIINNVIESSRFQYLVRYSNPQNVRKLAETITQKGNPVLGFVLARIPEAQLVRYYESCTGEMDGKRKQTHELVEILSDIIRKVDFKEYETIRNSNKASSEEIIRKERTKNILGLYLTVLFLLQKNLNYVNARYIIAFHCAERDTSLLLQDWIDQNDEDLAEKSKEYKKLLTNQNSKLDKGEGMIRFTELYYLKGKGVRYKKRVRDYVLTNLQNACAWSILSFRNNVAHLNVIRNASEYMEGIREVHSYFELYHYMMQKRLIKEYEVEKNKDKGKDQNPNNCAPNEKTLSYFAKVQKYGTYCKDYVKALNVPFAYNLPRYKNLSINELFDRNDYMPDKAVGWCNGDV